jgi:hypothetical protein
MAASVAHEACDPALPPLNPGSSSRGRSVWGFFVVLGPPVYFNSLRSFICKVGETSLLVREGPVDRSSLPFDPQLHAMLLAHAQHAPQAFN